MPVNIRLPQLSEFTKRSNPIEGLVESLIANYKGGMEAGQAPRKFAAEQQQRELANALQQENIQKQQFENQIAPEQYSHEVAKRPYELGQMQANIGLAHGKIGHIKQQTHGAELNNQSAQMKHNLLQQMLNAKDENGKPTSFVHQLEHNPNLLNAYEAVGGHVPEQVKANIKEKHENIHANKISISANDDIERALNEAENILNDPSSDASAVGFQLPAALNFIRDENALKTIGKLRPLLDNLVPLYLKAYPGSKFTNAELAIVQAAKPSITDSLPLLKEKIISAKALAQMANHRLRLETEYMGSGMNSYEAMEKAQSETPDISEYMNRARGSDASLMNQPENKKSGSIVYEREINKNPLEWFETTQDEYLKHLSPANRKIFFKLWEKKIAEFKGKK